VFIIPGVRQRAEFCQTHFVYGLFSAKKGEGGEEQRRRNRDRTTEIVARPPGDYESEAAVVS